MGWLLVDNTHQFDLLTQSVVFGLGLFTVCMFCHGELVAARPHPHYLGRFYAIVSLGGALGSAVVAFVAPVVLPSYYEVSFTLVVVMALLAHAGIHATQDGVPIGQLQLADFPGGSGLAKQGSNYFRIADPSVQPAVPAALSVAQGHLEASNSAAADSAVRLINVMRQFEMMQKAVSMGMDMSKQAIEQVAKVGS